MHSHQKPHKPILEMPAVSCREFFWFAFKDTKHRKGLLFGREGTWHGELAQGVYGKRQTWESTDLGSNPGSAISKLF